MPTVKRTTDNLNPKDIQGSTKPNLSRLPLRPLLETAAGLEEGARKYGPWNWRAGKVRETIYADAAIRHLMQFIAGEDIDPDSGLPHVVKAIAGLLILRDAQVHGCSVDDRAVNQDLNVAGIRDMIKEVHEKYPQVESKLPPRVAEFPIKDEPQSESLRRMVDKYGPEVAVLKTLENNVEQSQNYLLLDEAKFDLHTALKYRPVLYARTKSDEFVALQGNGAGGIVVSSQNGAYNVGSSGERIMEPGRSIAGIYVTPVTLKQLDPQRYQTLYFGWSQGDKL